MVQSILGFVIAVAIVLLILKLLGKSVKILWGILVNASVGFIVLYVLKAIGLGVDTTLLSSIIVGIGGIPGLVIVLILQLGFGITL